jgi:hypothetical protein
MKQFKDSEKRTWDIVVNVGTAKQVRELTTVNIFDLHQSEAERVFGDPCLLVDVLYVLCKGQCEARKMTDEDFGRSLVGDAIEDAANALSEEVADFFPSGRRAILRKQMAKSHEIAERLTAEALAALDKVTVADLLPPTVSQAS